jgi:hypothetical protein
MSPCAVFEFRYNYLEGETSLTIKNRLAGIAKKYCFQLEEGDSGYLHWQGRLSLIKKRHPESAHKVFPEGTAPNYLEPTISSEHEKTAFYVMKVDTRKDGPFMDTDEEIYIPRQVREMGDLRPFQKTISGNTEWDTRTINLVYNEKGNLGKTRLVQYMRAYKLGRALPPVNDTKDLLRIVYDLPTSRIYLFDMPRSLNKEKLFQFYAAVETIKDGYAYDDRYTFKEKSFDSPNIWIFTNSLPDLNMLSRDRWKIWTIDSEDYTLVKY